MEGLPLSVLGNILSHLDTETREQALGIERLEPVVVEGGDQLWSEEEVRLLNTRGWFIRDDLMGSEDEARGVAREISSTLELKQAGLNGAVVDASVRSDLHAWVTREQLEEAPHLKSVIEKLEAMRTDLKTPFSSTQIQATCYPANTRGYVRHLDASKGKSERCITMLYYANCDWKEGDGGELRLYADDGEQDVAPVGDRLLVFQSRQLEHEVLPTKNAERFAVTYWLYQ